jgi:hypothetical protein
VENNLTDEAGVALAEALMVNETLRKITLSAEHVRGGRYAQDLLSAPVYEDFLRSTILLAIKGLSILATRCGLDRD